MILRTRKISGDTHCMNLLIEAVVQMWPEFANVAGLERLIALRPIDGLVEFISMYPTQEIADNGAELFKSIYDDLEKKGLEYPINFVTEEEVIALACIHAAQRPVLDGDLLGLRAGLFGTGASIKSFEKLTKTRVNEWQGIDGFVELIVSKGNDFSVSVSFIGEDHKSVDQFGEDLRTIISNLSQSGQDLEIAEQQSFDVPGYLWTPKTDLSKPVRHSAPVSFEIQPRL